MKFDLLLFSMSGHFDFSSGLINNRNRSVWQELERRSDIERILFVDFLPFNGKTALKSYLKAGIYRNFPQRFCLRRVSDKTHVYATIESFSGQKFFLQHLREVVEKLGFGQKNKLVLWSYNPLDLRGWLDIPNSLRVFDTVDNWTTHSNFRNFQDVLRHNYHAIDEKADLIFTVAEGLQNIYENRGKVHWIANGVDTRHFAPRRDRIIPQLVRGIPHPLIGYVGVIQDRLDLELMEYVAKKYPHYSFLLVGPTWPVFLRQLRPKAPEIKRLDRHPNVHFLGVQPHELIPDYIQAFDATIIPHRLNAFTGSMNPLKLYEYLAMGKPVVSTPVAGLADFKDFVYVGSGPQQFGEQLERALAEDSAEKKQARIAVVQHAAWQERVNEMMRYIFDVAIKKS